jgi:hypothetical protein
MLFRDLPDGSWLAVSQPMHALVSGQILRAWTRDGGARGFAVPEPFEPVATACAQHDVAWMAWESAPSFDATTGRPHVFRAVGARFHAPMWAEGVERARASWGPLVALLVSRHGSLIYASYDDRHQDHPEDAPAARHYRETQAVLQARLQAQLGLSDAALAAASGLVAVTDALSLAVCGGIITMGGAGRAPLAAGGTLDLRIEEGEGALALDPWPFAARSVTLSWQGQRFAGGTRWADESAMRSALRAQPFETFTTRLQPLA